jgi:hypothetical protein
VFISALMESGVSFVAADNPEANKLMLHNREEVEIWLDEVDNDHETVMVAVSDQRIVGTAVLERQLRGWSRHVGEIRIVAEPAFRRRGLGHR